MLRAIVALALAASLVSAESAASQFGLNPEMSGSACFLDCHKQATNSNFNSLPGRSFNSPLAITLNCERPQWIAAMQACLPVRCVSAPDVAYAVEYGTVFCRKAGVEVFFELPDSFMKMPGGFYYGGTLE